MPNLSTAVDDFDDGVLNTTLWAQRIGTITESGGALHVPSVVGLLGASRAGTNAAYTFDQVFAQVQMPAKGSATVCVVEVMVTSPLNLTLAELGFRIDLVAGTMAMQARLAGVDLTATSVTYSATNHRWLRLRRDSGNTANVLWETSPNGVTWTVRRTAAIPLWLSANNDIRFFATAARDAGTPADLLIHNFNVAPRRQVSSAVTLSATGAAAAVGKAARTGTVSAAATGDGSAAAKAVRGSGAAVTASGGMSDTAVRGRSTAASGSAAGSLSAAGRGVRPGAAGTAGSGALTATGAGVRPGVAGLTGVSEAGSVPGAARATAVAADGTGTMSVPARGLRPAQAGLPGETAADAVPGRTAAAFAAGDAGTVLVVEAARTADTAAALDATGTAHADTLPLDRDATADLTGTATLDAHLTADRAAAAADLTTTTGLGAYPTFGSITDAPAAAQAHMSAEPGRTAEGHVTLTGRGRLRTAADRVQDTTGTAPEPEGMLTVATDGAVRGTTFMMRSAPTLLLSSDFTALAVREGETTAAATGAMTAAAGVVRASTVLLPGTSTLIHEGRVPVTGSGSISLARLSGTASVERLSGSVVSSLAGGSAVAALQPLTLYEGNDETLTVTLVPADGESLSSVTGLEFFLKADSCDADDADGVVFLSTENPPGGITIVSQSADEIVATIEIPASALVDPYGRFWRLDAMTGVLRRTAMYGPVTVLDL